MTIMTSNRSYTQAPDDSSDNNQDYDELHNYSDMTSYTLAAHVYRHGT